MRNGAVDFINKVPTFQCLICGKKNQQGNNCPYCGQRAKYFGLEKPKIK